MSQNKYAQGATQRAPQSTAATELLSEFSLTVQSRSHEGGVQWRAVFKRQGADKSETTTTEWAERSKFNADYAVIRNKLAEVVGMHFGRPH